jgi:uncharacterized protein YdeI (YjbR/CyaY-like superfamily)
MNPYISPDERANLTRDIHRMPEYVQQALVDRKLEDAYRDRPAYQKNDYIGWIEEAKTDATRHKRLEQMLDELRAGDKYMKMKHGG